MGPLLKEDSVKLSKNVWFPGGGECWGFLLQNPHALNSTHKTITYQSGFSSTYIYTLICHPVEVILFSYFQTLPSTKPCERLFSLHIWKMHSDCIPSLPVSFELIYRNWKGSLHKHNINHTEDMNSRFIYNVATVQGYMATGGPHTDIREIKGYTL